MSDTYLRTLAFLKQIGYFSEYSEKELISFTPDEFIELSKDIPIDHLVTMLNVYDGNQVTREAVNAKLIHYADESRVHVHKNIDRVTQAIEKHLVKPLNHLDSEVANINNIATMLNKIGSVLNKIKLEMRLPESQSGEAWRTAYIQTLLEEWYFRNSDHISNFVHASVKWLYLNNAIFTLLSELNKSLIFSNRSIAISQLLHNKTFDQQKLLLHAILKLRYFKILTTLQHARCRLIGASQVKKEIFFPTKIYAKITKLLTAHLLELTKMLDGVKDNDDRQINEILNQPPPPKFKLLYNALNKFMHHPEKLSQKSNKVSPAYEVYFISALSFLEEFGTGERPSFTYRLDKQTSFSLSLEPNPDTVKPYENTKPRIKS